MNAPSRLESLRTLRVANLDVAFATAFITLIGGSLLVGFIKHLGGSDLWIGLSSAIPALAGIAQIPGAVLGRARPKFKKFVSWGGGIWRLCYIPIVALPFIPIQNNWKLLILIGLLGIATISNNIVGPIYNEWIGKIVPPDSRGWYFSRRTLLSSIVGMVVGMVGAQLLDYSKLQGIPDLGFGTIFTLGIICAIVSYIFFARMGDTQREVTEKATFKGVFEVAKTPFADHGFRQIMWFVAVFGVGTGFAGNLFSAFAIESLEMPFVHLQMMSVVFAIGTVLTIRSMGFLADKYGNLPLLKILVFGVGLTPLMWLYANPGNYTLSAIVLIAGHIFPGIFWPGIAMTQMNLYLSNSEEADRAKYLATALAVQSVVMFVSPLAGSWFMSIMRESTGDAVTAYKYVFGATMVLRLAALIPLRYVREDGSRRVIETIKDVASVRPKSLSAMKKIRSAEQVEDRQKAIRNLGRTKFKMATKELGQALIDPSPQIRREAAKALGRLESDEAAQTIIWSIEEYPELVEEESLEALARTGRPIVTPILVQYLSDPSAVLRRAAAKGLGEIGDVSAIEPLVLSARTGKDTDLRRASIQALRRLGANATELYGECLLDPLPSIRTAAAEAVSDLEIEDLAPTLRQSLKEHTKFRSEIAYALGRVGDESDFNLICEAAASALTITTKRRTLLAAAHLYGLEHQLYQLMRKEGVDRDTLLMKITQPFLKTNRNLSQAMDVFSQGRDDEAVKILAESSNHPGIEALANNPFDEAFLLAILLTIQELSNS